MLDSGVFILGPEREGVRGGGRRAPRRAAHGRRRQRHRRARARARRDGDRPRRRGDLPRRSPSTRPPSRSRGAARRRSSPTSTRSTLNLDPEDVAARVTDADAGDHAGAPVRPRDAARRARRARDPDRRGRRAGLRRRRASRRSASLSTFSFFPTKNLFALGDGGLVAATDEELADRIARAPLPRLARQEGLRGGRLQLAPRRAAGRGAAPLPRRARRLERARAARPPRATRSSASASSASCPPTSPATSTTCTSSARPSATASARRSRRPGSATPRTTSTPLHLQPALRYLG